METETAIDGDNTPPAGSIQRLRCSVQTYDWGRIGMDSLVACLHSANSGYQIGSDTPYAELWMGTHESGPSYVVGGEEYVDGAMTLKDWICRNPNVLGPKVLGTWGCDLPFMFKVLSVAKALSIQAHPDKELATTLHKSHPNLYKDENHKPEMALAVTKFEALCGFVTLEELKDALCGFPEIVELVGKANAEQIFHIDDDTAEEKRKSILQSAFTQLMSANSEMTAKAIHWMKRRCYMKSQMMDLTDKETLVLQLEKQYPGDIGVISAFFFNHMKLNPGEALYLGANEPHAYLSGECVECMATSDNVVRAGLTPKLRDVETLCSMLTYKQGCPEILKGFPLSPYITRYLPPFDEFEVDLCVLPALASTVFPAIAGPSVFLVTNGEGRVGAGLYDDIVAVGDILFAPANTEINLTSSSDLQLYRAGVNSRFLQRL